MYCVALRIATTSTDDTSSKSATYSPYPEITPGTCYTYLCFGTAGSSSTDNIGGSAPGNGMLAVYDEREDDLVCTQVVIGIEQFGPIALKRVAVGPDDLFA